MPDAPLPNQPRAVHPAGNLAGGLASIPPHSLSSRRSRPANAWRRSPRRRHPSHSTRLGPRCPSGPAVPQLLERRAPRRSRPLAALQSERRNSNRPALPIHSATNLGSIAGRRAALNSSRRALSPKTQSLGRPPHQRSQPLRTVLPKLRPWPNPDPVLRHQVGTAPSLRLWHARSLSATSNHHGRSPRRHPDPHGPYFYARRTRPGLHPHRPGQRIARAHGSLSPRPAQRHDSSDHGLGPTIRRAASGRHRDRDHLLLARHWPPDHPSHR